MRTYRIPAAYARHVELAIAAALREVALDQTFRPDEDSQIRDFSPVPDSAVDLEAKGDYVIVVGHEHERVHTGGGVVPVRHPDTSVGSHQAPSRMLFSL